MSNALEPLILAAQQQDAEGERLIALGNKLKAEAAIRLSAYHEAERAFAGKISVSEKLTEAPDEGKKFDKVSEKWREIYAQIYRSHKAPFGYQDVKVAMEQLGHEAKIASIRSHMQGCAKAGMFSRPAEGQFAFTKEFIDALALDAPSTHGLNGSVDNAGHVQLRFPASSHLQGSS